MVTTKFEQKAQFESRADLCRAVSKMTQYHKSYDWSYDNDYGLTITTSSFGYFSPVLIGSLINNGVVFGVHKNEIDIRFRDNLKEKNKIGDVITVAGQQWEIIDDEDGYFTLEDGMGQTIYVKIADFKYKECE